MIVSGVGNVCSHVIACFLLKFPCQTLSLFSLSLASYSACPPAREAVWVLLVLLVVGIVGRICSPISFTLWYVLVLYSFLLLDNIPLYGCTTFYLPIHELVDI